MVYKIKDKIPFVILGLAGGIVGLVAGYNIMSMVDNGENILLATFDIFAIFFITYFIHLILHEAGHLIFGLISGYKFVSFRVGSLILVKEEGKFKFKRYSLAGTGGQCLLSPPDYNDGNYPYVLYNLGGIFINLILTITFLIIYLMAKPQGLLGLFCVFMVACGIMALLINGVPMKTEFVTNDGHNALHLSQDKDALKVFWSTLVINAKQMEGTKLSDMDPNLFEISDNADLKNTMITPILGVKENLYLEQHKFDEAKNLIDKLLSNECAVSGIQENLLKTDRLYIDVIQNGKDADLSILEDKKFKSFMRAMKNYPNVLRTNYVIEKVKGNEEEAKKIKEAFEKVACSYPYKAEIETERKLMEV